MKNQNNPINEEAGRTSRQAVSDASLVAYLEAENGSEIIPLNEELISLGSGAECNIVLNDPAVSRRHALLRKVLDIAMSMRR